MKIIYYIAFLLFIILNCSAQNSPFDEQMKVFNSLGYNLNPGIDKEIIYEEWNRNSYDKKELDSLLVNPKFSKLYYILGSRISKDSKSYMVTNNCIWWDIEFIDPSNQYIVFMKLMGKITGGEINFENIKLTIDDNNYEWIEFKVNNINKKWKLAPVGYISDSFFQRFSYLPDELNTKGKYTIYSDGGQQFVIDYATEKELKEFREKTGLNRYWLGEGNDFRDPTN